MNETVVRSCTSSVEPLGSVTKLTNCLVIYCYFICSLFNDAVSATGYVV